MSLFEQVAHGSKTIRIHPKDFAELTHRLNSAFNQSDQNRIAAEFLMIQGIAREPFTQYVFQVDRSMPVHYSRQSV